MQKRRRTFRKRKQKKNQKGGADTGGGGGAPTTTSYYILAKKTRKIDTSSPASSTPSGYDYEAKVIDETEKTKLCSANREIIMSPSTESGKNSFEQFALQELEKDKTELITFFNLGPADSLNSVTIENANWNEYVGCP